MANFLKSLFVKGVEIDPAGATSDQVLKYNGTKFVPGTASTVGSIDDLSDVAITSPTDGQVLKYNTATSLWANTSASGVAIQGTAPASTSVLWADTSVTGTAVVPVGGTTNQVLAKTSSSDYATAWQTSQYFVCTSSTRPSSPITGQMIFETDTNNLLVWNGASWMANGNAGYKVGDTGPGGGIIFFVDRYNEYSGFTYLEVAPIGAEVQRSWATDANLNQETDVPGANLQSLGGGYQNTLDIVAQTGNVAATCAAKYCADLTFGGQSDWYLPSYGELKLIYDEIHINLGVGGFADAYYSSSTENFYDPTGLWSHGFYQGDKFINYKPNALKTRPVRRF